MSRIGLTLVMGLAFGFAFSQSGPALPQTSSVLRQAVPKSAIQSGFGQTRQSIGTYNKNLWDLARKSKSRARSWRFIFIPSSARHVLLPVS